MKYKKRLAVIVFCMMTMLLAACGVEKEGSLLENASTKVPSQKGSGLEVQFLDIGQGDSILLTSEGKTMLVDAGNNEYGNGLVSYLKERNIDKIDYLIGTHPDADHIGGLDVVINKLDIGKIYMPKKQNNTKTFEDVLTAISRKGLKVTAPKVGDTISLGSATVTILGPMKSYDDNNNCSIVLKVTHGDNSFLLMGDAELEAEEDIIESGADLSATVLKAGHHGSHSSTSQSLLKKVNPTYAVISCALDNKYGHPHKETMTYFKRANVEVYRTDKQKTITMESDGKKIVTTTGGASIASSKTNSNYSANTKAPVKKPGTNKKASYIGNVISKKFHIPACSSLPKKENQVSFASRQEAIKEGYDACGRCNP